MKPNIENCWEELSEDDSARIHGGFLPLPALAAGYLTLALKEAFENPRDVWSGIKDSFR
jgi:hypothetical protein